MASKTRTAGSAVIVERDSDILPPKIRRIASRSSSGSGSSQVQVLQDSAFEKIGTRTSDGPMPLHMAEESLDESSSDDETPAFGSSDDLSGCEDTLPTSRHTTNRATAQSNNAPPFEGARPDYAAIAVANPNETPLQADIREIWIAISLFLDSQTEDAEAICRKHSDDRLYYSLGLAMITSIRSLMTFEPDDLSEAIELCKNCLTLASAEKNKDVQNAPARTTGWTSRLVGGMSSMVRGGSSGLDAFKAMSAEQRHAEVCYAECLIFKALLTIVHSGNVYTFVKEALNMRSAFTTYRDLAKYIDAMDSAHPSGRDPALDLDFRSTVDLGNGLISLIVSLLPPQAGRMMEMIGISGSREHALELFMRTGGWKKDKHQSEPSLGQGPGKEGLMRCVCDLVLLAYHLVISVVLPVPDVDLDLAERILKYNLQRYPDGIFFLWFSGKLLSTKTMGEQAITQFHKAIRAQQGFRQAQHICHWDLALTHMSLAQFTTASESLSILASESNWSKAVYTYAAAVTLYESTEHDPAHQSDIQETRRENAAALMRKVPGLRKGFAGKSLPIEKYAISKAQEFVARGDKLPLAGLELAYITSALQLAPRNSLQGSHLPQIEEEIARLGEDANSTSTSSAYWHDDHCLAHLLKGVVLHLLAHPDEHVIANDVALDRPVSELESEAEGALNTVIEHGHAIEHNRYIIWFAHLELGRLYTAMGPAYHAQAKEHLTLVLDEKVPMGPKKGRGKVSLQSKVVMRAQGAMARLQAQLSS